MTAIHAMRGIVNGASSASLLDLKTDPYTGTALKVSHLVLNTAQTFAMAGNPVSALQTVAITTCALTPIAMFADYHGIRFFSENSSKILNAVYQTGIIVNCAAMLALGHPVYALASLSTMVLNAFATGQLKNILDTVKKACSAIAITAFGAQVFAEKGPLSNLASTSAILLGVKGLLNLLESMPSKAEEIVQKEEIASIVQKEEVVVSETIAPAAPVVEEPVHWIFRPMSFG